MKLLKNKTAGVVATLGAMGAIVYLTGEALTSKSQSCDSGWSANNLGHCAPDDIQEWLRGIADPDTTHNRHNPQCVTLPPGDYTITDDDGDGVSESEDTDGIGILIDNPVCLNAYGAIFQGADGLTTIKLTTDADGSILNGVSIRGGGKHDTTGSVGMHVQSGRSTFRDLFIADADKCIVFDGDMGDTPQTNTNGTFVNRAKLWRCRHGMTVDDDDANGMLFVALDFNNNSVIDVAEDSELGNTYVGLMTHPGAAQTGDHLSFEGNNQAATLVGVYIEGETGLNLGDNTRSVAIGGDGSTNGVGGSRFGGQRSYVAGFDESISEDDPQTTSVNEDQGDSTVFIGRHGEMPIRMQSDGGPDGPSIDAQIRYFSNPGKWCFTWDGTSSGCVAEMTLVDP